MNKLFYILLLFTLSVTSLSAQAQKFELSIQGFEKINGIDTVKVRIVYPYTDKVYALWHSTDLKNWTRVELEVNQTTLVQVDSNQMPQYDYYVKRGSTDFFRIDTYIPSAYIYNRNLTVGSRGPDVSNLQTFLQEHGYMHWWPDEEKGFFGDKTRSALAQYQFAHGIIEYGTDSGSYGYFGSITRASINAR